MAQTSDTLFESQETPDKPKRGRPAKKAAAPVRDVVVVEKATQGLVVCTVKSGLRISEGGALYEDGDSFETTPERARQLQHVVDFKSDDDAKAGENRMISEGSPDIPGEQTREV